MKALLHARTTAHEHTNSFFGRSPALLLSLTFRHFAELNTSHRRCKQQDTKKKERHYCWARGKAYCENSSQLPTDD